MDGYRIRRGERETRVPNLPAIRQAVAADRLRLTDEVWLDERWQPLAALLTPKQVPVADDPWAAWNDAEEVDAARVVDAVRAEADELPVASVAPMAPALASSEGGRVATLAGHALEPIDEDVPGAEATDPGAFATPTEDLAPAEVPVVVIEPLDTHTPITIAPVVPVPAPVAEAPRIEPPVIAAPRPAIPFRPAPTSVRHEAPEADDDDEDAGPSGQLIDFPRVRPSLPPLPEPKANVAAPPLVRPWRVAVFVALGASVLVGAWTWVRMENANARALAPLTAPPEDAAVEDHPGAGHLVKDDGQTLSTEKALRAVALGDPRALHNPGDLGDALLIDLQNLRVETIRVDAPVTQWGGKKGRDPVAAEVRVTVQAGGEPDRELGAVALAVGRYKSKYTLELPLIEVTLHDDKGDRRFELDQVRAEQFAQGRIGLAAALGV